MADRQGGVFVGAMRERLVDEQMTRRAADHLEHVGVGKAFFVQALDQALSGTLGGHADTPAMQVFGHHVSPPSHSSRPPKASWKVRSSCNGVIDT